MVRLPSPVLTGEGSGVRVFPVPGHSVFSCSYSSLPPIAPHTQPGYAFTVGELNLENQPISRHALACGSFFGRRKPYASASRLIAP
jgi:hypothetical protein